MAFPTQSPNQPIRARVPLLFVAALAFCWLSLDSTPVSAQSSNAAPKITKEQAGEAALKALPGKVADVAIEKKKGKNVYVVEVVASDGSETDVFVDLESGLVLGMEK